MQFNGIITRSRHCRRARSRNRQASIVLSACERLELRSLLSGITLITHGFGGDVDGWVQSMADDILGTRPDGNQPVFVAQVTDPGRTAPEDIISYLSTFDPQSQFAGS